MGVSSKSQWTIGELASETGLSVRALRHYEEVGLLSPERSEGGHRRYEQADVTRLRQIVALRAVGLGLQQIAAWLESSDPELLRKLAELRLREAEARLRTEERLRTRLAKLVRSLEHPDDVPAEELIEEMEERAVDIELSQIHTGLGDAGETQLADLRRVAKTDVRIEAGGALDELGAQLAVLLAEDELDDRSRDWLTRVESDLFDLGSDLAWPPDGDERRPRIGPEYVEWLEAACDQANKPLEPVHGFLLPDRSRIAAQLDVCSAVCRRAERRAFAVGDANPEIARYLNRLSDFLFILHRVLSQGEERLWQPGAGRKGGAERW